VSAAAFVPVVPVPLSATSEGEPATLLVIVIVPVSAAPAAGLNTAEIDVLCPAASEIGRCGPEAVKPLPATEIPETLSASVPELVSVTVFVMLCPIATLPKLTELGDISIATPVTAGVVPLPVTPTQPEVTRITTSTATPHSARRIDSGANCREWNAPFTRAPSRMGARVITTRIVRWGRLPELLAEGTHLGQGHYPVREDRLRTSMSGQLSVWPPEWLRTALEPKV